MYIVKMKECVFLLFIAVVMAVNYFLLRCRYGQNDIYSVSHVTTVQSVQSVSAVNYNMYLPRFARKNKYFIYRCTQFPCGGWADRRKGVIAAYLISLLSNRTFGILHTFPVDISLFWSPNKLNWKLNGNFAKGKSVKNFNVIDSSKFAAAVSNLNFSSNFTEDIVYYIGNLDIVDELRRHRDVEIASPWLGAMATHDVYRIIWDMLFKPDSKLLQEVESFYSDNVGKRQLACAHVRLGRNPSMKEDNGDDEDKIFYKIKDINRLWNFIQSFLNIDHKIFVASDSANVKSEAKRIFKSKIVDTKGAITHMDRSKRNVTDGFRKAIVEFMILSRCDVLVLTLSGFGAHAAYTRSTSDNLYCLLRDRITPCSKGTLKYLYGLSYW